MKVTALLLIAIVCVSSSTVYKRLGKTQSMAALAQVSTPKLAVFTYLLLIDRRIPYRQHGLELIINSPRFRRCC